LDEIHYEARHDPSLVDLRDAIKRGEAAIQKFSDKEGLLWYQGGWFYLLDLATRRILSMNFMIHPLVDTLEHYEPINELQQIFIG